MKFRFLLMLSFVLSPLFFSNEAEACFLSRLFGRINRVPPAMQKTVVVTEVPVPMPVPDPDYFVPQVVVPPTVQPARVYKTPVRSALPTLRQMSPFGSNCPGGVCPTR